MDPQKLINATRELGKPADWDEARDGPCTSLDIADARDEHGNPIMYSKWSPDAAELAALNAGADVVLTVWGSSHPPVAVNVTLPPVKNG